MSTSPSLYHRHRFPAEFISHCVWLYFRFALSYRDIEEIMAVRGVTLTYETVRDWCRKFGQIYANALRRKHPRLGDHWHLDEMFIRVNGRIHYLWRAVDQDGEVLNILVQSRRDKRAAKRFFRRLLEGLQYVLRVIVTGQLGSYRAAKSELMPGVEHRRHKGLNSRAENSHQPTRLREKVMRRFKSVGHARAIPLRLRHHLVALQTGKAPVYSSGLPRSDGVEICRLDRGELRTSSSLKKLIE